MAVVIAALTTAFVMLTLMLLGGLALQRRINRLEQANDTLRNEGDARRASAENERDRFEAVLERSLDAFVALDAEGAIAYANAAAVRLFDRPIEELTGRPLTFVLPSEEVREAIRAAGADSLTHSATVDQPGRAYLHVFASPAPGNGWATLLFIDDLTDVKRTEQVRRDFVANVSHELRTPLASLKSVIETLEGGALEDEVATREFLGRAQGEIERMVQIMEELLELSKMESGEVPMAKEPFSMNAVVDHAVERLQIQAQRAGIGLSFSPAGHLPELVGDADRLERVVLNLIHNALKFTPANGTVEVQTILEGGGVSVRVLDSGIGVAPADAQRIFERFYKVDRARASEGTGLGLAIVKHTVEAHGGQVAAESRPGGGSIFSFTLPLPASAD